MKVSELVNGKVYSARLLDTVVIFDFGYVNDVYLYKKTKSAISDIVSVTSHVTPGMPSLHSVDFCDIREATDSEIKFWEETWNNI